MKAQPTLTYLHFVVIFVIASLTSQSLYSQQTLRGTIFDEDSKSRLAFASVYIKDSDPLRGTTSDEKGNFSFTDLPIGKYTLVFSYTGYEPLTLPDIRVESGKETVISAFMKESFEALDEIVIKRAPSKVKNVNELSIVSTRRLSIKESSKYAASLSDPARQAQNFAGVVNAGDDVFNDIVIRGNSPRGLLWRLDGIEIANPNHFASAGGSGGAVSMLSSNVLSDSDFSSGAFSAEYGNALSGFFDLQFRKGNNQKHEKTISAGFLGLEFAAEGPLSQQSESSYLLNYRYSTLGVLNAMGIKIAGDFLPSYQDLNYNLSFSLNAKNEVSFYGVLGNFWYKLEGDNNDESSDQRAFTGIFGVKHRYFFSEKGFIQTIASLSTVDSDNEESTFQVLDFTQKNKNVTARLSTMLNYKINAKHLIRSGIIWSVIDDQITGQSLNDVNVLTTDYDLSANTQSLQFYTSWKWRLTPKLTLNSGIHSMHYALNKETTFEPRMALQYKQSKDHSFSLGLGIHSRAEAAAVYKNQQNLLAATNNNQLGNLRLSKAFHAVLGYDYSINRFTRLKVETYYQDLYDIISSLPNEFSFSSINAQNTFDFVELGQLFQNNGKGRNYGLEITLEQFLNKGFYYLSTISLYKSEFSLDGNQYFNSRYDGGYAINLLAGKEFPMGTNNQKRWGVNAKATFFGGQRYTAIDEQASLLAGEEILSQNLFGKQLDAYYRFDVGVNYTIDKKSTTHKFSLDIQNVTNRQNVFDIENVYDPSTNTIFQESSNQAGIIPVFKYTLNF